MQKNNPLVSVVIPTHNRKVMVLRLLKSVISSSYKNIEIIVIDDASSDNTLEFLEKSFKYKNFKIIRNKKNLFTAGSRNVGTKISKGDCIFFIDDDNVLDKHTIASLVKVLFSDDDIGEVGPVNYNFNKKNKILWFITYRNMFTTKTVQPRVLKRFSRKTTWETVDIPNAFMVKAKLIKEHKIFFREKFGIMYEESDVAYRIRNLGYKVMTVKAAKIYHDIEVLGIGKKSKDYMYHFMEDKRRPFVFARNRIIFHSLYSNRIQNLVILSFWVWFFVIYYSYKFIFYKGYGKFNIFKKLTAVFSYIRGTLDGIAFVLFKTYKV